MKNWTALVVVCLRISRPKWIPVGRVSVNSGKGFLHLGHHSSCTPLQQLDQQVSLLHDQKLRVYDHEVHHGEQCNYRDQKDHRMQQGHGEQQEKQERKKYQEQHPDKQQEQREQRKKYRNIISIVSFSDLFLLTTRIKITFFSVWIVKKKKYTL